MRHLNLFFCVALILTTLAVNAQPGTLDGDFDADGKVVTSLYGDYDRAYSVKVLPDGKILIAGYTTDESDFIALLRYLPDGSLDNSFGVNGVTHTKIDVDDAALAMALQDDEKIVLAGRTSTGSDYDFVLVRYNSNGNIDNTFGPYGAITTDFNGSLDWAACLDIQSDGKIVAGGSAASASSYYDFAIARYNSDGSLDNSFSNDGKIIEYFSDYEDGATGLAIQTDGKIVVGGYATNNNDFDFAVLRYNTNGTPDNSFSYDGRLLTAISTANNDIARCLIIQTDGKIIVGGSAEVGTHTDFAIVRYNSDGTLDQSFSGDGKVITLVSDWNDEIKSLALQPDGKIIAVGKATVSSYGAFAVVRYNEDGSLDDTFGTGGIVLTDFSTQHDYANSVCLQPNGRIVVAGNTWNDAEGADDIGIARYISGLNIGILDFSQNEFPTLIYPNPIHDQTTLEYELEKQEVISVGLFDLNGKLIQSFMNNEQKEAGSHKENILLNESVKPGVYFLSISNHNSAQTIKIIKK